MEKLPAIGSRVKFIGKLFDGFDWRDGLTGTVTAHYPGGDRCYDEENGEYYIVSHSVAVKVDKVPRYWPYPDTDKFAPSIDELEQI